MNPNGHQLVLCEDDPDTLEGLAFLLTEAGFSVSGHLRAEQALPVIIKNAPLAVITDLDMPGMNGEQLCASVRQTYSSDEMLIIGISGRTYCRRFGSQTRFDHLLQKPIAIADLLGLIANFETKSRRLAVDDPSGKSGNRKPS